MTRYMYYKFCHWHLWRLSTNSSMLKFGTNFSHLWRIGTTSSHLWRIGTNSSHLWAFGTDSSHLWQLSNNSSQVWRAGTNYSHLWKLSTNSSHLRKIESCSSQMARMRTNSSHFKMRKMWNSSTDVRTPKLSKLTICKFHIFQKWRIGANSSHGVKFAKCEICGSTRLAFRSFKCSNLMNCAFLQGTKELLVSASQKLGLIKQCLTLRFK